RRPSRPCHPTPASAARRRPPRRRPVAQPSSRSLPAAEKRQLNIEKAHPLVRKRKAARTEAPADGDTLDERDKQLRRIRCPDARAHAPVGDHPFEICHEMALKLHQKTAEAVAQA